jgi:endonuclease V-like protein UPF0215 family
MANDKKTNSDRILRIHQLCEEHFGAVRFVGVKYHTKIGWVAKVQFEDDVDFGNLTADGKDATDALRKLKNRVKKIIKRYNVV